MELAEMKAALKAKIKKHYTHKIINPSYDDVKQRNIARLASGYVQADLDAMNSFIDGKRADIDVIETDVDALENTDLYDNFTTDSDANMMVYVVGILTNLTTDEQKLAVAIALQNIIE